MDSKLSMETLGSVYFANKSENLESRQKIANRVYIQYLIDEDLFN